MKSPRCSILLLLVALAMPTPTEAFLADILQLILSIFIPDWKNLLCEAVLANIPDEIEGSCTCKIDLAGSFDFNVGATCADVANTPCDVTIGSKGNFLAAIFNGVDLNLGTTCDLGLLGVVKLTGEGTLSLNDSDIDKCTAEYDPPILPVVGCTCSPGCSPTDPFAVSLKCLGVIDSPCINFLNVIVDIFGTLTLRQAEGKALVQT